MKAVLAAVLIAALSGCATQSANIRIGSGQSYASLRDQREASISVKQYPEAPAGAEMLGSVDASRCHRNALDAPPDEAMLMADLKVAAYARGADGIAAITKTQESGLLKNCWYVITVRATAFRIKS